MGVPPLRPCHCRIHQAIDEPSMARTYNTIKKLRDHEKIQSWLHFMEGQPTDVDRWIITSGYPEGGPNPVVLAAYLDGLRHQWPLPRTEWLHLQHVLNLCEQTFPHESLEVLHLELILRSQPEMKSWGFKLLGDAVQRTQAEHNTPKEKAEEESLLVDNTSRLQEVHGP
ncbi:hypothetical protein FRB95_007023 [Tulasnella sp. JGI-2019a]|nr:hypothetical protein FRB95_007023 [Tulasnella sp. JGI-2019a]